MEEEEAVALKHDQKPGLDAAANIPAMLYGHVEVQRSNTILRKKDRGIWKTTSWSELGASVRQVGMGLKAVGFKAGEIACILADTSPAWVITDLGILGAGGISAGLYTTEAIAQLGSQLRDCACRIVFVGNEEQLDKILQVRDDCPRLERIVIFNAKGLRDFDDPMCESLEAFVARGQSWNAAHLGDWDAGIAAIGPDDGAVLTYTSGATGAPKAVILSHRSILFQISNTAALLEQHQGDERLAFLPMPHFMERILGLYQSLYSGTISNYIESAETVRENLQEVMPTVVFAPPRIWERTYFRVTAAVAEASWLQRQFYRWAMGAGERLSAARRAGEPSLPQRWTAALGSLLVLRKVRRTVGLDRVRIGGIGGAPVSPDLVVWFGALGIELTEFYGLSECAGVALALPAQPGRNNQTDRLAAFGELKLSPEGEILVRGEHLFSGYWREGAHSPRGGTDWFPTGDSARIENGVLRFTGRTADLITTRSGVKVTPSEFETELSFSPYIADALIFGHDRDHLGCLVMIDHENVEKWAHEKKIAFSGVGNLARTDAVRDLIDGEIRRINGRLAEPIRTFRLIERVLEPEDPELTPMMKLRRQFVSEKYRNLIESMYCEA